MDELYLVFCYKGGEQFLSSKLDLLNKTVET